MRNRFDRIREARKVLDPGYQAVGNGIPASVKGYPSTHRVELKKLLPVPHVIIDDAMDVVRLVADMQDYDREYVKILHLNAFNKLLGIETVSIGTIDEAIVRPREILKGALLQNASSIIFVHNHPSGNLRWSQEDIEAAETVGDAAQVARIDLVDAMLIVRGRYLSMRHDFPDMWGGGKRDLSVKSPEEEVWLCDYCKWGARYRNGEPVAVITIDGEEPYGDMKPGDTGYKMLKAKACPIHGVQLKKTWFPKVKEAGDVATLADFADIFIGHPRIALKSTDILLKRVSGSKKYVGAPETGLLDYPSTPHNYIVIRVTSPLLLPKYLYDVLQYLYGGKQFERITHGTVQQFITVGDVKRIPLVMSE